MGRRLLIVDDEGDIVTLLKDYFELNGYEVMTASDGHQAIKKAEKQPDMILLDIGLPGQDGLEVCRQIRDFVFCPILFLTARAEDSDKIRGFAAGGDDYIVKPFSLDELGARVSAHFRRELRQKEATKVKFDGGLVIDYSSRQVFIRNESLNLAKKEFDIIELLSQNPGQVFDKERIYDRVWGYDSEGGSTVVAEHIRRIRAKLASREDRALIETVWGVGYKWVKI